MANRPIYSPLLNGNQLVDTAQVEFKWYAGMSVSQKQKSIDSLHNAAKLNNSSIVSILEISSKSKDHLGVCLSAFNLKVLASNSPANMSVECAFQGSKVFKNGGPYIELYEMSSREAKGDSRLKSSGNLIEFNYLGCKWPISPQTAFYDWLYLTALKNNPKLAEAVLTYDAFSDIEFNPLKSINCQAYSAALFKSLTLREILDDSLHSPESFINIHKQFKSAFIPIQANLI